MQTGAVPKPHSRSRTSVGSTARYPPPYTPAPPALLLESPTLQNPQHRAFLGFQNAQSVPLSLLGLAWVTEAKKLPLPCPGARAFRKPGLSPSRPGLLEPFVACKFYSIESTSCSGLAWGPPSAGNHGVPANGTPKKSWSTVKDLS